MHYWHNLLTTLILVLLNPFGHESNGEPQHFNEEWSVEGNLISVKVNRGIYSQYGDVEGNAERTYIL